MTAKATKSIQPAAALPAVEADERHQAEVDAFIQRNRAALNASIQRSRGEVAKGVQSTRTIHDIISDDRKRHGAG
ncbi:MAG: hypothetical protein U1C74_29645 [Phenylobacterium sp.]|nr:hypothetical protein [Phenylobacterium sp.]